MNIIRTEIPDVLLFEPQVVSDDRGLFFESYNERALQAAGVWFHFVQDNQSKSEHRVLRGLHYQIKQPQGKLVRVISGMVYDVAVDLRRSSPTFGKSIGFMLSEYSKRMAWIPPGFAHGFLVWPSEEAEVLYKVTDYYAPEHERTLLWNDPALGIQWPAGGGAAILSEKDRKGLPLCDAETYL